MQRKDVAAIWSRMDRRGDGAVLFKEFCEVLSRPILAHCMPRLKQVSSVPALHGQGAAAVARGLDPNRADMLSLERLADVDTRAVRRHVAAEHGRAAVRDFLLVERMARRARTSDIGLAPRDHAG